MKEHRQYIHFLKKIRERLTLLFDHNLPLGKEIIDSDRELLHVLYKVFDHGEIERLSREPLDNEKVTQVEMFKATSDIIPFENEEKTDESAEKHNGTDIDYSKK